MGFKFTRAVTGYANLQAFGQALHQTLLDAGWTCVFADADAQIGGGSAVVPTWGKTAVVSTIAGRAVYRMPGRDTYFRWLIDIQLEWGTTLTHVGALLQTGDALNGSNVFVNPGTRSGYRGGSGGAIVGNSTDTYIVANDDGFVILFNRDPNASGSYFIGCERRRNLDGTVVDECLIYGCSGPANTITNPVGIDREASCFNRKSGQPEDTLGRILGLRGVDVIPTTLTRPDNTGYSSGFFCSSGGLSGQLRLFTEFYATDSVAGNTISVVVDGVAKSYWLAPRLYVMDGATHNYALASEG